MKRSTTIKSLWITLLLLAVPVISQAKPITFQFTGTVYQVLSGAATLPSLAGVTVGTPVSGSYTFESTTPGTSNPYFHINKQMYYYNALNAFDITFSGHVFTLVAPSIGSILVQNDSESAGIIMKRDIYDVNTGGNLVYSTERIKAELILNDGQENAGTGTSPDGLTSSALPLQPPDLTLFDTTTRIDIYNQTTLALRIDLTSLTRAPNIEPMADAGETQVVLDQITLNGYGSSDPDGSITSYDWQITHRASGETRSSGGAMPTLTGLAGGIYDVVLAVTDDEGATAADSMFFAAFGVAYTQSELDQAVAQAEAVKDQTIGQLTSLLGGKDTLIEELQMRLATLQKGDLDEDCDVDGSDLALFSENFGRNDTCRQDSFIGSWGPGLNPFPETPEVVYASFTLYPNGYYVYWEDRLGGGVEYGSYDYDPATRIMTFNAIVDEDKTEGPTSATGNTAQITVSGDTLCIDGAFCWNRVADPVNPIVGGWGEGYYGPNTPEAMSLTIYPNGYYIHYETDDLGVACDNGGGVDLGTYTYNQATGLLSINPIIDQNGCIGPADNGAPKEWHAEIIGNSLAIYDDTVLQMILPRVQ